jgi:hypothetical protein
MITMATYVDEAGNKTPVHKSIRIHKGILWIDGEMVPPEIDRLQRLPIVGRNTGEAMQDLGNQIECTGPGVVALMDAALEEKKAKGRLVYRALLLPDGNLLPSMHRHDYRTAYIDDEMFMIDGGLDYFRSTFNFNTKVVEIHENDDILVVREVVGRSGKGKDGGGVFRACMLKDMSDEWVEASIAFAPEYANIYSAELSFRKLAGISITGDGIEEGDYCPSWEAAWDTISTSMIVGWFCKEDERKKEEQC